MAGSENLMLGSIPAQYQAQKKQAAQRRDILNQAWGDQRQTQDNTNAMLVKEGQAFSGDARQKAMDDQQAATLAQTQQDLASAGAGGEMFNLAGGGNVSSDFIKAKADKAISEGNRLTALAQEAAKVRAPGLLQSDEKQRQADVLGRTGSMWATTRNKTGAAREDAANVQEPWYGEAGRLATQIAMMAAMA